MDTELLERFRSGDPGALGALAAIYGPGLLRFLVRYEPDPATAEDLVQETFVRVYERRADVDPARSFRNWLYTVALNLARDRHNVARRRDEILRDASHGGGPLRPADPPQPDVAAQEDERAARVRTAVQSLPEPQRLALILHWYEGWSYAEIAEAVAAPVGTIKSRMAAALAALRPVLREVAHGL